MHFKYKYRLHNFCIRLEVLKSKQDISDGIGIPDWKLTLYLLAAWIIVFLVIIRGVKSSGKVAYFLAIFPYLTMITLLVKASTLEGAVDGIIYFITPKWSELLKPKVGSTINNIFKITVNVAILKFNFSVPDFFSKIKFLFLLCFIY